MKAGLTGGIGSGKSLVAAIFSRLGVPVYQADLRSREILHSKEVTLEVVGIFGDSILDRNGEIERQKLASVVFRDTEALSALNSILHPKVKDDFSDWCRAHKQHSLLIHEAAIIFESGFDRYFDRIIVVDAPVELCIRRVMKREGINREAVLERMKMQWSREEKIMRADYILMNDEDNLLLPQVLKLYQALTSIP